MSTDRRKLDHIRICLSEEVEAGASGFEDVVLIHSALPEVDLEKVRLETRFLGRRIAMPVFIAAMTGGHEEARKINENLALAAQELDIPLGVGSQRAAIEDERLADTFSVARKVAPEAYLIANLGAVQFSKGYSVKHAEKAIDMISADAIALHLNPLQEACQKEGDTSFEGAGEAIAELCEALDVPVIVKETGAGIAAEEAALLQEAGVSAIDVGGAGGTSFALVESYRGGELGRRFASWGIPTAVSVVECSTSVDVPVFATGGVRSGVDVAKAIALGASACGIALPLLRHAVRDSESVVRALRRVECELRVAAFLTGSRSVEELSRARHVILGRTREWLEARGILR
ncbi:type 2 isopentenyl-diphosphate Delta-isomerase [Candidatus Pyrohabitans sp.]